MEPPSAPGSTGAEGVTPLALEVRGLTKTFGGVKALRDAALEVRVGEVHGLVGENGSGKSTLIKVLAGFHAPDAPTQVRVGAHVTELPLKPGEAARLGMTFVHQDLGLIPDVSVLDNLLMDEFVTRNMWYVSARRHRDRAQRMLESFGLSLALDEPVSRLRPTERALLAIARAAARIRGLRAADAGAHGPLVLDEPTVYLPEHERQRLFTLMHSVASEGVGIIFVSHDVKEVLANTHRVTVIRDGLVAGTVDSATSSADEVVSMILGRELSVGATEAPPEPSETESAFQVGGLSGRGARGLSMEVRPGEILGLTGLPGAGFDDVPYLLFGAEAPTSGVLRVDGVEVGAPAMTPARALELGMALIPADRQAAGAIGSLPVVDNVSLQVLPSYRRGPILSRRQMVRAAEAAAQEFDVRPRDPRLEYSNLSGGNQQKVLLAKWFLTQPKLLLLHEPTQGVDVGARGEIFALLRDAARNGCAVVVASSDHEQLVAVCSRVAIVRSGAIVQELQGDAITQDTIGDACYADAGVGEASA